ncbi:MAG: hypothetical protein U1A23_04650, partial [Candidatus Sungbacteria bacterium]|nr:hypothetical protein [Candidatus Sungbacteria bacterium]
MKNKLFQDLIFKCGKCGHLLFITNGMNLTGKIIRNKLRNYDCPNCGEESEELWIFVRNGSYDQEHETSDL